MVTVVVVMVVLVTVVDVTVVVVTAPLVTVDVVVITGIAVVFLNTSVVMERVMTVAMTRIEKMRKPRQKFWAFHREGLGGGETVKGVAWLADSGIRL